ncbi:MAG: microviridin/marinostatin family tricyclic proteinase inhibitor [Acidobacteria bacterium]|nr:microviridin/marinostatin family tricyclic proteinase inhibitor [Acidobacteriota bacterium]
MNNETEHNTTSQDDRREQAVTPFFARFLEGQHADAETGPNDQTGMTLKYPSDRDEQDCLS